MPTVAATLSAHDVTDHRSAALAVASWRAERLLSFVGRRTSVGLPVSQCREREGGGVWGEGGVGEEELEDWGRGGRGGRKP